MIANIYIHNRSHAYKLSTRGLIARENGAEWHNRIVLARLPRGVGRRLLRSGHSEPPRNLESAHLRMFNEVPL